MAGFALFSGSRFSRSAARRKYEKLAKEGSPPRRRTKALQLGSAKKRKFVCKIRILPKFSLLRLLSPKNLLMKVRDAYINMMMGVASKGGISMLATGKDSSAFSANNQLQYGQMQAVYWNYLQRSIREGRIMITLDQTENKTL